ncbi:MAG: PKD domain-containing protein [Thermoplasmata archaeon]
MFTAPRARTDVVVGIIGLTLLLALSGFLGSVQAPASASSTSSTHATPPAAVAPQTHLPPQEPPVPPSAANPAAAPTLNRNGQSPSAIGLSWSDLVTETFVNYTVREASAASHWAYSTWTVITAATTTTYVASGLSPGVDYDWEVLEYQETCFIVCGTPTSLTTSALNGTQPAVAFLHHVALSPTGITLEWTNNATYGGLISFEEYTVWESAQGAVFTGVGTISNEATNESALGLSSGDSYSFYIETSDCTSGCTGGTPSISTTQSNLLTVGTPLTLSATVLARSSVIDLGQSDYFTCTPTGGESPFAYAWNFTGTTYVAGNASESAILGPVGVVTVTCEITDSETPASHAAASADVTVNPPLVVTVSENRSAADVGQPVGFTCTPANGTAPYALSWVFGDQTTSTLADPSHAYTVSGGYAPACAVSDNAGSLVAPTLPLVVSPTLEARATVSSPAAAPGTALIFSAQAVNGSGTYDAYSWTFGTGVHASGQQVDHTFSAVGTYSVSVQISDSNSANATGAVAVDISNIVVAAHSVTSASVGAVVSFNASASGGAGAPFNFTWNFGDGSTGYGASVTHAYSTTGTETPRLTVTDQLGATNVSTLPSIAVAAAPTTPAALSWLTGGVALAIALLVGVIIAVVVLSRRRAAEASEMATASSAYVPPTDPKRTIRGAKICTFCGASNLPIRTTCSSCGKPLPRGPGS